MTVMQSYWHRCTKYNGYTTRFFTGKTSTFGRLSNFLQLWKK